MGRRTVAAFLAAFSLAGPVAGLAANHDTAAASEEAAPRADGTLFTISRSKNANQVVYSAQMAGNGFDTKEPVKAVWHMLANDGHTEDLTGMEKKVYGVKVESASAAEVVFILAALPSKPITLRLGSKGPEAVVELNGEPCVLEKVYISSKEGLVPKVRYVEATGVSLRDGGQVQETIKP